MSQFYTPEYIDENYPEHCRTSCSDEHPINAEVNGHGCLRCNALLFQKQEAEHEEITRLRAELAKVTWQRNEARADLAASRAESERLSSMIDHQRDEAMEMERMLRAELAKVTWQRNEAQAGLAASRAELAHYVNRFGLWGAPLPRASLSTIHTLADQPGLDGESPA